MAFVSSLPINVVSPSDAARTERPASDKAVQKAEEHLQQQVFDQVVTNQQRIKVDFVQKMRADLKAKQFSGEKLSGEQINQLLTERFDSSKNPLPLENSAAVMDAARGESPAVAAAPQGDSPQADTGDHRGASSDTFSTPNHEGEEYTRLARGDVRPGTPQPAVPARPVVPPQQPTPQAPAPQALAPQTPTKTATAPLVHDAPPAPEGAPASPTGQPAASPTGQPVVATGTGAPVSPEAPAPQPGVQMITYGDKPPAGTDHERIPFGREQHVKFQVLTRPLTPGPVLTPQGTAGGGMRLADLLRKPTDSRRGRDGEEGCPGGSLDRSFAIGMRRQFRDTAC